MNTPKAPEIPVTIMGTTESKAIIKIIPARFYIDYGKKLCPCKNFLNYTIQRNFEIHTQLMKM
jgi:hypothetical protein